MGYIYPLMVQNSKPSLRISEKSLTKKVASQIQIL